jgi:hypothetical protein
MDLRSNKLNVNTAINESINKLNKPNRRTGRVFKKYIRNSKEWIECEITELKKGDVFYITDIIAGQSKIYIDSQGNSIWVAISDGFVNREENNIEQILCDPLPASSVISKEILGLVD